MPTRLLRAAAVCFVLAALAACANWPANDDSPADTGELLRNSLPVAAAALAAGQLNVARRLYLSLSERFDDAPEPFLGLGYIALQSGDAAAAEGYFLKAAERAADKPALRAEALLGAGRTALVQGNAETAGRHFRDARAPAQDTPSAPWIANGLAVTAALEADYAAAEIHYVEALRLSSDNPRIAANFIRMLVAAGRIDDAARTYARHPPTHWPDDDGLALSRLIEEARRQRRVEALASPRAAVSDAATTERLPTPGDMAPEAGEAVAPAPEPSGARAAGPEAPETRDPVPPRAPDPDLAMRLYLSDALPVRTDADARTDARGTPPDRSGLLLVLDGWPGFSTLPPAMVDDSTRDSTGPRSSEAEAPPSPAAPAPSDPARPHPLPAPEVPALASLDHTLPATVNLVLGQSRRIHLDHDATTVLVAAPEVADVQLLAPNVLYVIGKGVGRTSVAVLHDNERIEERIVAVALDLEPLRTILAGESDLRGVQARRLSRGIALTGEVDSAASVDRALRLAAGALPEGVSVENEMEIAAPQQVNLEVQIAEVHRSVTEDLGVNWEAFRVRGNHAFGFRVGRVIGGFPQVPYPEIARSGVGPPFAVPYSPPLTDAVGRVLPSVAAGFPPAIIDGQLSPSAHFGRASGATRIGAMIDALATAGLANVLARPNVTAVSGESASFFSGGERPIPTGYDPKTETILFEYKKVGVLLDFVPTVVDSGRIVLTVRPEVSEPDASQPLVIGPVLLPVINVRRAETTVEVGDGESIVIAGLFSNRSSTNESGVPGLKDVPLLGLLFGTTSIRSNELELIVIVTARLVRPNTTPDDTSEPAATLQANGYHY
ncbi:MAG: pilus assembly protein N-terminal domain-containing protein [Thiotrichales bacterium]|nr:pilus assembly protein N-terminal domain-containing protein [Thiotrichales bacterium]